MAKKESRLNLRIDSELLEKVRKLAERDGTTVTAFVVSSFRRLIEMDLEEKRRRRILGGDSSPEEADQVI